MNGPGRDDSVTGPGVGNDAAEVVPPPVDLVRRTVVRPYVLTGGRTASSLGVFELHAPVLALDRRRPAAAHREPRGPPDRRAVPDADVGRRGRGPPRRPRSASRGCSSATSSTRGMVQVRQVQDTSEHRDVRLLERLLEGIRAL